MTSHLRFPLSSVSVSLPRSRVIQCILIAGENPMVFISRIQETFDQNEPRRRWRRRQPRSQPTERIKGEKKSAHFRCRFSPSGGHVSFRSLALEETRPASESQEETSTR